MVDDATRRQINAADPDASTWLSANAGSGKTKVLTDRVARLFLKGVPPQNILCLTYTKAAASEMQNRLYKRLGEWAMLPDPELIKELSGLGSDAFDDKKRLAHARTLFARAVEAPGGLRIQTIHSFCSSLLRRFPTEAGISPAFRELDDAEQGVLWREALDEIAGSSPDIINDLSRLWAGDDLDSLINEILKRRDKFSQTVEADDIWRVFGLAPEFSFADVIASVFLGDEAVWATALRPVLEGSDKKTDQKLAGLLAKFDQATPEVFWDSVDQLLFKSGGRIHQAKTSDLPTKALRTEHPDLCAPLHGFMSRVENVRERAVCLTSAEKTRTLWRFAKRFIDIYERLKFERGYLDFDDLITKTTALLSNPSVAQWVLYRLDGSIDHILVDEAQDTSPEQWRVIELLAQEIGAGKSAREDILRTIFVVGDTKQSIYSFQGADPREFSRMKEMFAERLQTEGRDLASWSLDHSFRSSQAILDLVDRVLLGNSFSMEDSRHIAFHNELPGRVDLWPVIEKQEKEGEKQWYDPTDMADTTSHQYLLAQRIADEIAWMQRTCSLPEGDRFRPVSFGDFLILVRSRSRGLFQEIIRACKKANLPIAGADRLKLGGEVAVKDMIALLSFLNTPDDDLSLACALRSPLFGLSEDDLFRLANGREEKGLWLSLYANKGKHPEVVDALSDLRERADFASPYQLLERVLNRFHGRRSFLARLGTEAEEGMDALLDLVLKYESQFPATLTGFLEWYAQNETEIKRQPEAAGDRIRIMTIHGAKGLESPIVILPETDLPQDSNRGSIIDLGTEGGLPAWKAARTMAPKVSLEAIDQAKRLSEEERFRLLYVAMTRAEKWLIVCGSGDRCRKDTSWYETVEAGMRGMDHEVVQAGAGDAIRIQHGAWDGPGVSNEATVGMTEVIPDWANRPAGSGRPKPKEVTATDLGGAKVIDGLAIGEMSPKTAARRGTFLHKLLEHLPAMDRDARPAAAAGIASSDFSDLTSDEIDAATEKALALVSAPDLAPLFGGPALTEVDVAAPVEEMGGANLYGSIDRMIVTDDLVWIVDFKSNTVIPNNEAEIPVGIMRQMGAYAKILGQIYPERALRLSILWTNSGDLVDVNVNRAVDSYSHATMS